MKINDNGSQGKEIEKTIGNSPYKCIYRRYKKNVYKIHIHVVFLSHIYSVNDCF